MTINGKIVNLKSLSDSFDSQYVSVDPMQGGVKDVYFSPDKSYVVAFFRKELTTAGKERIEKLVSQYRKNIFEQQGGDYWKDRFCWPQRIVKDESNSRIGIVVPAYDKKFIFGSDTPLDGVEKEGKWFASAKNLNKFVPPSEKGNLLGYLRICLNLSRAVRRLHAAGLAHSDLSYKNCLVNPSSGDACIIDIDGLVVPGVFQPDVIGTPDFIAPEVVATADLKSEDPNRKWPCRATDQHALAVLVYLYLFHRHPLRGSKVLSQDSNEQEKLEMGDQALFIEHPTDESNRLKPKANDKDFQPWIDTKKLPYTIAGPYLKRLFNRAFIEGLHKPELRPSADDWEDALVKTTDLVQPCSNPHCIKGWYVFDNSTKPVCPYCGTKFTGQLPVLDLYSSRDGKNFKPDNHRVMVYDSQYLYPWHVHRNIYPNEKISEADKKPVGYFSFFKNRWIFINQTLTSLRDLTKKQDIPIGKYVEIVQGKQLQLSSEPDGRVINVSLVSA
ncbi:MAG: kinase [Deltaproteobacteria bacterium]|jgi:DNA-binding helix-hairpin-helix protein with protein kinase domain|nr:kinase [Deltaproteobacteria bacterium]